MNSQGYLTLKQPSLRAFLASINTLPNRFPSKCLTGPPEQQHVLPKYEYLAGFHSVFFFFSLHSCSGDPLYSCGFAHSRGLRCLSYRIDLLEYKALDASIAMSL